MQYQRRFLVDSITRENLAQFMRDRGPKNLLFQATPVQKKKTPLELLPHLAHNIRIFISY
jgi:hypothetical protein